MTKFFYDTEFIDDGEKIEFISIGMVREDGVTYYAITDDPKTIQRAIDIPWLRENVIPYLPIILTDNGWIWDVDHIDYVKVKSRSIIRRELTSLIRNTTEPELWAWYGAYDHIVYAQLFGKMIDLPLGFPMHTCELKQLVDEDPSFVLPGEPESVHNALADAWWNLMVYEAFTHRRRDLSALGAVANPNRVRVDSPMEGYL